MKVAEFGIPSNRLLVILAPAVGLGIGLAGYALFKRLCATSNHSVETVGDEDLGLPLALENDYGDFRARCQAANAEASGYLNVLPEAFFNFQNNLSNYILSCLADQNKLRRALVIGSSTAGFAFDLSKHFAEIKGIENSFSRVVTSYQFQNGKSIAYFFPLEGSHFTSKVTLNHSDIFKRFQNQLKNVDPLENVQIVNADPDGRLSFKIGVFQVIVLFVLTSLLNPEEVLSALHRFVEPDGLLFIVSDYNWTRFTNRNDGFQYPSVTTTFDFLKHLLQKDFTLENEMHMPGVTPLSLRSCTIHNYHVTTWRRFGADNYPTAVESITSDF